MTFSFNYFIKLPLEAKQAYLEEHADEIESMTSNQKEQIALLLCRAAPTDVRKAYPINYDRDGNPQDVFNELEPLVGAVEASKQAIRQERIWQ